MIILDTDHVTILQQSSAKAAAFYDRVLREQLYEEIRISIVSYEEQFRGWLSFIARSRSTAELIFASSKLESFHAFFKAWKLASFEDEVGNWYESLRRQKIRIGTPDLKIAAIAMANNALLLSANLRDFRRIPNLRVENWLK